MSTTALAPSSPKRAHSGGDDDLAAKKQKTALTGLEGILADFTGKKSFSTITSADQEIYFRRAKVAKYTETIRKQKKLARKIPSSWNQLPQSAQQGMKNLTGALCYRHSLFQAFIHSPKVAHWLRRFHSPEHCVSDDQEHCISCHLRNLSQAYWTGGGNLTKALIDINEAFKINGWKADVGSGHGDPEEQLAWIRERMEAELPSSIFSYFEAFHSLVLSSSVPCTKCGYVSKTEKHATGPLSVAIKPRITKGNLSMYLSKYMDEIVEGYKCDKCGDSTEVKHRYQKIDHSPDILVVQFKRFDWDGRKDSLAVPFSSVLDLNRYRSEGNEIHSVYELSAVVSHRGSLGGGHYRCTAMGADKNWHIFDDERMSRATAKEAVDPGRGGGWTPYLLFFQRMTK